MNAVDCIREVKSGGWSWCCSAKMRIKQADNFWKFSDLSKAKLNANFNLKVFIPNFQVKRVVLQKQQCIYFECISQLDVCWKIFFYNSTPNRKKNPENETMKNIAIYNLTSKTNPTFMWYILRWECLLNGN